SGALRSGVGAMGALRGAAGGAGGAVGALAGVVIAGTVAWHQYSTAVNDAENALMGIGRGSGLSSGARQAVAQTAGVAPNLSRRSAQRRANAYIRAGVQGEETLRGLIERTADYAAVTGQDAAQAQAELARAMRDPEAGLRILE